MLAADGGFIGHEDLEGKLRLVLSEGRFFHLSTGEGFAGAVFRNGVARICDLESPFVERPTAGIVAEMGAPLRLEGRTIGVVVLDRHRGEAFQSEDLRRLVEYAAKVDQLLESAGLRDLDGPEDLASLLTNGKLAFEAKRYQSAERLLGGVLSMEPQNVTALHLLGEIYLHTRRYVAAREVFSQVVKLEPGLQRASQHLKVLSQMVTNERTTRNDRSQ